MFTFCELRSEPIYRAFDHLDRAFEYQMDMVDPKWRLAVQQYRKNFQDWAESMTGSVLHSEVKQVLLLLTWSIKSCKSKSFNDVYSS